MKRRICFRADAGATIGYGHFIRSLALADMLKDDFDCVFFTTEPSQYQIDELDKVCQFVILREEGKFEDFLGYLDGTEIVVLDNYFFTTDYQRQIRAKGCKLVCIDDMHDKHYVADVVINHALTDTSLFDCEPYTKLCLGFDYALLRAPFLKPIIQKKRCSDFVVCFGGADVLRLADKVVSMLLRLQVPYHIIVILGDVAQISEENRRRVTIKRRLSAEQMADVFEQSEAAILSASTVSIEALSREMSVIIGYYVDNQKDYCQKLSSDGLAISVDILQDLTEEKLAEAIRKLDGFKPVSFNSYKIKGRYIQLFNEIVSCN